MITLDKWRYEKIVSELIDGNDIRIIAERFSMDRVFYFHVLRDIASGERSPNFKLLRKIADKRKVSTDFIIEQARLVINYTIPNYQSEAPDYYKTLGVDRDASDAEIRRSWIELMKSNHPDLAGSDALDAAKKINEAYNVIGSAEKREAYDRKFLPPVPVVIPTLDLQKNIYIGAPILFVILVALIYAAGSGLIFKSQEEKEMMARVIEHPSMPNPVYRGDSLASRSEKLEETVAMKEETSYEVPSAAETIDNSAPLAASQKSVPAPEEAVTAKAEKPEPAKELIAAAPAPEKPAPAGEALAPMVNLPVSKVTPGIETEKADEIKEVKVAEAPKPEEPVVAAAEKAPEALVEAEKEKPAPAIEEKKEESKEIIAVAKNEEPPAPVEEKKELEEPVYETLSAGADVKDEPTEKAPEPEKPLIAAAPEEAKKAPETAPAPEKKAGTETGEYYTVLSGDSLWTIARKFDTTMAELARLNDLKDNKLKIGDKIIVSGEPLQSMSVKKVAEAKKPEPAAPKAEPSKQEVARVAPVKPAAAKPEPVKPEPPKQEIKTAAAAEKPARPAAAVKAPVKAGITDDFDTGLATTAIARGADVMRKPEPIPAGPDKNTLYGFVTEYVTAYRGKNLARLKTLFSSNAVENGVDLPTVLKKYDASFSTLDVLDYDVKVHRAIIQNEFGFVRGDFFITYRDTRTGMLKNSRGNINWKLAWAQGEWKIVELNYKIESSGGI